MTMPELIERIRNLIRALEAAPLQQGNAQKGRGPHTTS